MLRVYPERYHEVHNDLNHAEVADDIDQWLQRYLPVGSSTRV